MTRYGFGGREAKRTVAVVWPPRQEQVIKYLSAIAAVRVKTQTNQISNQD